MALSEGIFGRLQERLRGRQRAKEGEIAGSSDFLETLRRGREAGVSDFRSILQGYFDPEYRRLHERQPGLEEQFLEQVSDPEAATRAASEAASVATERLFDPRLGTATQAYRGATGRAQKSGFGAGGSGQEEQEYNIISEAAGREIGRSAREAAAGERQFQTQMFGGFTQAQQAAMFDAMESLFTGLFGERQLDVAEEAAKGPRQKILGIF